jgi:hypothetical protein
MRHFIFEKAKNGFRGAFNGVQVKRYGNRD